MRSMPRDVAPEEAPPEPTPELRETEESLRAPAPDKFEDGFTWKTFLGALFIAIFMLPGGMYLGLVAGQGDRKSVV